MTVSGWEMNTKFERRKADKMRTIEKLMVYLMPIPLAFLFTGTRAMIQEAGPFELNAISFTLNAFSNHFEIHVLILTGALCLTLMLWFATRKYWR